MFVTCPLSLQLVLSGVDLLAEVFPSESQMCFYSRWFYFRNLPIMAESADIEQLLTSFRKFAVHGDMKASGKELNGKNWAKLCKDCKIIDGKHVTSTDVDIVFSKVKWVNWWEYTSSLSASPLVLLCNCALGCRCSTNLPLGGAYCRGEGGVTWCGWRQVYWCHRTSSALSKCWAMAIGLQWFGIQASPLLGCGRITSRTPPSIKGKMNETDSITTLTISNTSVNYRSVSLPKS